MATITEDYISFETAKLLKEKGFDNISSIMYKENGAMCINPKSVISWRLKHWYPCLTLQMAMKWLREVHNLYIWIGHTAGKVLSWYYEIHGISDGKVKHIGGIRCGSYEIACESAIKYCLENLI